jgi:hypothetical protein
MRKYLYAGVVAGGFLLLGAAPAYADVQPVTADAQQDPGGLGGLLDPTNGMNLGNPLLTVDPGDNSFLPPQNPAPPARTGFGQAGDLRRNRAGEAPSLPAADVARRGEGLPIAGGGMPTGLLGQLPAADTFGGGIPVIGGLLPNGGSPLGRMDANQEAGLLDGGVPLLGGLGGLLPGSSAYTMPTVSGMPAGGSAVPVDDQPAPAKPATNKPAGVDPAIANDHRLHEEPIDPEDQGSIRTFSDGRPIAGLDPDFS